MANSLEGLIVLVVSSICLWFFGQHLAKKIRTQSTTDATGSQVSKEQNPELYRFHVAQLCVLLTLLSFVALASVYRMLFGVVVGD
ncbi:hypothetical protein MalM25_37400 [Planctomycetes bacterium MalM25]|nr:hypothetical protein MalM25_37400 [Planctomycetes bacterium MalM25]